MQSDFELVKAILDGRTDLYSQLLLRYEASVKAMCYSVLTDMHLAADASQDAFIKAFENLGTLRNPKVFGAWLMRIAKRRALDMLSQQQKANQLKQTRQLPYHDTETCAEIKRNLLDAMMKLPKHERQTVLLRYFEGHSVRQVASITQRSVGTVTKQLSRAHRRLRILLQEAEQ